MRGVGGKLGREKSKEALVGGGGEWLNTTDHQRLTGSEFRCSTVKKTLDCTSTTFPLWPSFCTAHSPVHDLSHMPFLCF